LPRFGSSRHREIAQELYVTLKTVEGTLGKVYAKLDISGRGAREALPKAISGLGEESSGANTGVDPCCEPRR
jgi:hypothetical protein